MKSLGNSISTMRLNGKLPQYLSFFGRSVVPETWQWSRPSRLQKPKQREFPRRHRKAWTGIRLPAAAAPPVPSLIPRHAAGSTARAHWHSSSSSYAGVPEPDQNHRRPRGCQGPGPHEERQDGLHPWSVVYWGAGFKNLELIEFIRFYQTSMIFTNFHRF
jgi:hypothetical protein